MVRVSVLVSLKKNKIEMNHSFLFYQNDCLNNIVNAERRGKRQVLIRPSSKVVVKFLSVMQRHGESIYTFSEKTICIYIYPPSLFSSSSFWTLKIICFFSFSIQDTLANSRSSMTIVPAKSSSNSTAISTKRVSSLPASTSNTLKSSHGSTCCYLLEVSVSSSSYVDINFLFFFRNESLTWNFILFYFILFCRPLLPESLITKKLVVKLWEENF